MLFSEILARRRIWAVTVVPMLAPMIMPTVCSSFMTPALTKPTHITVVVAEEWMIAVTRAPSRIPLNTLLVRRSRIPSKRPLESCAKPSVMVDIPNRNSAIEPSMEITLVAFKGLSSPFSNAEVPNI